MSGRKRTAVMISGRGSNMNALITAANNPDFGAEIALVFANTADAPGLATARARGIETRAIDHTSYDTRERFDQATDQILNARGIELVACAGYMRILSAAFVAGWRGRIINIHPSLLPAYPGTDTHARALADGVRIHGCTVHFVTAELDSGPIIAQAAVPVCTRDDEHTLARRVLAVEHRIYPMALDLIAREKIRLVGEHCHSDGDSDQAMQTLFSPFA